LAYAVQNLVGILPPRVDYCRNPLAGIELGIALGFAVWEGKLKSPKGSRSNYAPIDTIPDNTPK
jgi:hypothetical protein